MVIVRIEAWNIATEVTPLYRDGRRTVAKVVHRTPTGQFDGATNRRGSVIEHPRP